MKKPRRFLKENIDILHKLAESLLEKETVLGAELDEIITAMRPGIELPTRSEAEKKEKGKASPETGK